MAIISRAKKGRDGTPEGVEEAVSLLRAKNPRIVCVADLHLWDKAPAARAEEDWLGVQARYLDWLGMLNRGLETELVYAGDIFDHWKASPELINFAIEYLPRGYAVPGNHDLPNHNYEDIEKSAYWTLVKAEVLENLPPDCPMRVNRQVILHGFPHGFDIESFDKRYKDYQSVGQRLDDGLNVAVVHDYVWQAGSMYPGAGKENHKSDFAKRLIGYGAAVFGDNHSPFEFNFGDKRLAVNCGCLIRRKSDERKYTPRVAVLCSDGMFYSASPADLVNRDKWSDRQDETTVGTNDQSLEEFMSSLRETARTFVDFAGRLEAAAMKLDAKSREIIIEALDKAKREGRE